MRDADMPADKQSFLTLSDGRLKYDHSETVPTERLMPISQLFNPLHVGTKVALKAQKYY